MKIRNITRGLLAALLVSTVLLACRKDNPTDPQTDFDRGALLKNIGNTLIIPSYLDARQKAESLSAAVLQFNSNPVQADFEACREAYVALSLSWQGISPFGFGPADQAMLEMNSNIFPTDTAQIQSNIGSGSYNLSAAANLDAKGLPALDYLLFRQDAFGKLSQGANAANARKYLSDLAGELSLNIGAVYNSWVPSGGNYIQTFGSSTGTDVGSSVGLLVNQLNFDFESLKNFKIAIPLGKRTLGTPYPDKVEAYYSGNSLALALRNLQALEALYLGAAENAEGTGFDDYLIKLGAQHTSGTLNDAIKTQFNLVESRLKAVPGPLSQAVVSNAALVDEAYVEMQKLVVLLKTDLASALGVQITYQDNDGD